MKMDKEKIPNFWNFKSTRLYLSLTFGLAVFANAMIRNTLSMAMVCMVNSTVSAENQSSSQTVNSSCASTDDLQQDYQGTYYWGSYEQGLMFSALFIGGLISTMPAGWLADRYDPKLLVTLGIFITSLGCFLTPITADDGGYIWLIVLRFIMGLFGQALIIPGIGSICARWIPPNERSTVIALYTAGNQVSNIIGMPMNAALCGSSFLKGWPAIFYVNGVFGVVSGIIWIIVASNRPQSNKFISEREKNYIMTALESQNLGIRKDVTRKIPWAKMLTSPPVYALFIMNFSAGMMAGTLSTYIPTYFKQALNLSLVNDVTRKIPFKKILTSPPVLSLFVMNFSAGMMYGTLSTYMPTYYKDVLNLSLLNNGLFGALPYIVQWLGKMIFAAGADLIKRHTKLTPTLVCKVFNTISCVGVTIFLIACAYMDCSTYGFAIAFLSIANALLSANVPGFQTAIISVAPSYSGIMMAFSRTFGQFAAFLSPLIVAALTPQGTANEWRHVFFLISGVTLISGLIFAIFGSAAIQDWAKITKPNIVTDVEPVKVAVDDPLSVQPYVVKKLSLIPNDKTDCADNDELDRTVLKF